MGGGESVCVREIVCVCVCAREREMVYVGHYIREVVNSAEMLEDICVCVCVCVCTYHGM